MTLLSVRVHPGARHDELRVLDDGTLDVRVRARAVDGRANEALIELLAIRLKMRRSEIAIARGAASRVKLINVDLPSREAALRRLGTCK